MHLEINSESAKLLIVDINDNFPIFYKEITEEEFDLKIKEESPASYYRDFMGNFLAGKENEELNKGTTNIYPKIKKSYFEKQNRIITDITIIYQDIYLVSIKGGTSYVPYKSIKRMFEKLLKGKSFESFGITPVETRKPNLPDSDKSEKDSESGLVNKKIVSEKWIMYCFSENSIPVNGGKQNYYGIKEALIEFSEDTAKDNKERWKVNLWSNIYDADKKIENIKDYEGFFGTRVVENKHIYLETTEMALRDEENRRHLRMMLYFGNRIDDIALGVFYNIRFHGALLAGSLVLVKITNDKEKIETYNELNQIKKVKSYELEKDFVKSKTSFKKVIWDFFSRRNLNYLKLPNLESDSDTFHFGIDELAEKLQDLKVKGSGDEVWLSNYDFFMSIPLTFDNNPKTYELHRKIAYDVMAELDKLTSSGKNELNNNQEFENFYFAGKSASNLGDFEYIKERIARDTLDAIERSKIFVLIFPSRKKSVSLEKNNKERIVINKVSSANTELGYAMALKKRIIVFYEKDEKQNLPGNLEYYIISKKGEMFMFDRDDLKKTFKFMDAEFIASINRTLTMYNID